jgi:hypothetical protein
MASGVPRDTYKRYKEDTLAFTTWLSQVAKTCGWKPTSKPQTSTTSTNAPATAEKGPRLKGKERKLAREAAKSAPAPAKPEAAHQRQPSSTRSRQKSCWSKSRSLHKRRKTSRNVLRAYKRCWRGPSICVRGVPPSSVRPTFARSIRPRTKVTNTSLTFWRKQLGCWVRQPVAIRPMASLQSRGVCRRTSMS